MLLLLVTAGLMTPVLWGEFVYDDISLVVQNPRIQSLSGILCDPLFGHEYAYWRPLTGLLMGVSMVSGGAAVLHGISLTIHLAGVGIAFSLAKALTKSFSAGIFTASIFALHPVQVESLAWGSAVQDPLVGLFVLCSLQSLVRWRRDGSQGVPKWPIAAFALALLSKEIGIVVLPAMFLLDWLVLRPNTGTGKRLYMGLGAVLGVYMLARMWVFGSVLAGWDRGQVQIDPTFVGDRLITAPIEILGEFVSLMVQPWPLLPFRDVPIETSAEGFITHTLWLLLPLCLGAWAWYTGRRVAVFGICLALGILLLPALRFNAIGSFPIADRYMYLPVFGFALALAPRDASRGHLVAAVGLVAVFSVIDTLQIPVWRTQECLIEHGLRYYPQSPTLLNMKGKALLRDYQAGSDHANLQAARRNFLESVEHSSQPLGSDVGSWRGTREEAHLGLAWCELLYQHREGQPHYGAAIQQFKDCINAPGAPADAWIGLGVSYGSAGRLDLAEPALTTAVEMAPWNDRAHYNLGYLYSQIGRNAKAIFHLETALRLQPENKGAAKLLSQLR